MVRQANFLSQCLRVPAQIVELLKLRQLYGPAYAPGDYCWQDPLPRRGHGKEGLFVLLINLPDDHQLRGVAEKLARPTRRVWRRHVKAREILRQLMAPAQLLLQDCHPQLPIGRIVHGPEESLQVPRKFEWHFKVAKTTCIAATRSRRYRWLDDPPCRTTGYVTTLACFLFLQEEAIAGSSALGRPKQQEPCPSQPNASTSSRGPRCASPSRPLSPISGSACRLF